MTTETEETSPTEYPTTPCACGHGMEHHNTVHMLDGPDGEVQEGIQWHEFRVEGCDCEAFWREE